MVDNAKSDLLKKIDEIISEGEEIAKKKSANSQVNKRNLGTMMSDYRGNHIELEQRPYDEDVVEQEFQAWRVRLLNLINILKSTQIFVGDAEITLKATSVVPTMIGIIKGIKSSYMETVSQKNEPKQLYTTEIEELSAKLKGLRNNVISLFDNPLARYFPPDTVHELYQRYLVIQDRLRSQLPRLFADLPKRELPKSSETTDFGGKGYITKDQVNSLLRDIDYCITVLSEAPSTPLEVTREGIFFAGEYFDALKQVTEIFSQAQLEIAVIDGYIDANVLNLFSSKPSNVQVNILTKTLAPALEVAAKAFNKQYGGLNVRISTVFHDRFVIVDNQQFYHFGASIKDLGHRGFMFSLIEEPMVVTTLRTQFQAEWVKASIVIS